jgi:hypothetical protein
MSNLSLDDIKDGSNFEDLVAAYFRCLDGIPGARVDLVGIGPDGGGIIIYEFYIIT